MHRQQIRAQSTLEYILVVSAILAVIFAAAKRISQAVDKNVFTSAEQSIGNAARRLPGAGGGAGD